MKSLLPVSTFRTTPAQVAELRDYAGAVRLPVSEVIRLALDEFIKAHPAPAASLSVVDEFMRTHPRPATPPAKNGEKLPT